VALKIGETLYRRILVHHQGLWIRLHGRAHGHQRFAVRQPLEHMIRRPHGELRRAHRYLLFRV
jgi:hypothetical protein